MNAKQILTADEVTQAGIDDWEYQADGIRAEFATGSFAAGLEFVNELAAAAEDANHHPDVLLTYPTVDITLLSHDVGGVTVRDVRMAQTISQIARDLGISPV